MAGDGVVVVGGGVGHHLAGEVVGQEAVVGVVIPEGKLENRHAREAEALAQGFDLDIMAMKVETGTGSMEFWGF